MYGNNPRSTAQIAGHPIHPLLIPFPIVSFIGALVTVGFLFVPGVRAPDDRSSPDRVLAGFAP